MAMDKIDNIAGGIAAAASVLAALMPDDETRIIAFNALGAVMGGFAGASLHDKIATDESPAMKLSTRWVTNFTVALPLAPIVTQYLANKFPEFSPTYIAIASGGVLGIIGVLLVCIGIPALKRRLFPKKTKLP